MLELVPAAHGLQVELATAPTVTEKVPLGQSRQAALLTEPLYILNVPALQGVHSLDPCALA